MDREALGESEGIPWRRNSLGEFARVFSKKFLFMRLSLCVSADSIYKRPLTHVHLVLAAQKTIQNCRMSCNETGTGCIKSVVSKLPD